MKTTPAMASLAVFTIAGYLWPLFLALARVDRPVQFPRVYGSR